VNKAWAEIESYVLFIYRTGLCIYSEVSFLPHFNPTKTNQLILYTYLSKVCIFDHNEHLKTLSQTASTWLIEQFEIPKGNMFVKEVLMNTESHF